MNSLQRKNVSIACFVCGAGLAALAPFAHAEYRCNRPVVGGDARACAASREGADALRRFVFRTRGIYALDYWDFVRPEPMQVADAKVALVASNPKRAAPDTPPMPAAH